MLRVRQATLQMSTASNSPLRQRLSDGFQELAFPCDAGDRLLSRRCPLFNGQGRGMARASHVRGGTYEAETKQSGRRGPLEPQGAASISHSFWEDTQVEICMCRPRMKSVSSAPSPVRRWSSGWSAKSSITTRISYNFLKPSFESPPPPSPTIIPPYPPSPPSSGSPHFQKWIQKWIQKCHLLWELRRLSRKSAWKVGLLPKVWQGFGDGRDSNQRIPGWSPALGGCARGHARQLQGRARAFGAQTVTRPEHSLQDVVKDSKTCRRSSPPRQCNTTQEDMQGSPKEETEHSVYVETD